MAEKAVVGERTNALCTQFWVPNEDTVWEPCQLKSRSNGKATYVAEDGQILTVAEEDVEKLASAEERQLEGVEDICSLSTINEGAMLHTVRVRYARDEIYTRVARVLIAVNPFAALPLYSSEHLDQYAAASDQDQLPPHIFGLSQGALKSLRSGGGNQVILISGESGAGKTESAKLILSFVAEAARSAEDSIEDKILRTSPIFESFGNAMTVRNNNSSRFGKWLGVRFNGQMQIVDCSLENYLLETTRVCGHSRGERSYHIFYQLLNAREQLPHLGFQGGPECYRYLRAGEKTAPGIDDARSFEEVCEAFEPLGFNREVQAEILNVVAGVLTLGNCEFKTSASGDESHLVNEQPAVHAASLLGVDVDALKHCLLRRKLIVDGNEMETHLREEEANQVRDSLAQLLYGRLFEWLVREMNAALSSAEQARKAGSSLGILDIAGFESFETNSMEQLMINLSNEHLQQSFNSTVVKAELDDYAKEGVTLPTEINFTDNADVLELLDGKAGIFDMVDEECNLPKGTDAALASKIAKAHAKHKRLVPERFGGKPKFTVAHFAGEVVYDCIGFLEKNSQKIPAEAPSLLSSSSLELLRLYGGDIAAEAAKNAPSRAGSTRKKQKSTSLLFRQSLRVLTEKIALAERHYIRCVKPNKQKVPGVFDSPMVIQQLLFSGILDAIRIRQQGYSLRIPFAEFVGRYACIVELLGGRAKKRMTVQELIAALPSVLNSSFKPSSIVVGHTKVLVTAEGIAQLDKGRNTALDTFAARIQAVARGVFTRRKVLGMKGHSAKLAAWLERIGAYNRNTGSLKLPTGSISMLLGDVEDATGSLNKLSTLLDQADELNLLNAVVASAREAHRRLGQELEVIALLERLLGSIEPMAIEKALARARGMGLQEPPDLLERHKKLVAQLALVKDVTEALDANAARMKVVIRSVEQAGLKSDPAGWLPGLGGAEAVEDLVGRLAAEEAAQAEKRRVVAEKRSAEQEKEREAVALKKQREEDAKRHAEQQKVLGELTKAVEEYDALGLEKLLKQAADLKVSEANQRAARTLFEQLQSEAFVREAIAPLQAETEKPKPSALAMRQLLNLSEQLRRLVGNDTASRKVRTSINMAAVRARRSGCNTGDNFVEDMYSNLADFPGLKPTEGWRGHRATIMEDRATFTRVESMIDTSSCIRDRMLCHSRVPVVEALTRVSEDREALAVRNFRDILICMGDRPAQECQRQAAQVAVMKLARTCDQLGDEVFIQVMKQVVDNQSARSASRGWDLLFLLCISVAPSDELIGYVRSFLRRAALAMSEGAAEGSASIADMAKQVKRKSLIDPRGSMPVAAMRSSIGQLASSTMAADAAASARRCLRGIEAMQSLPRIRGYLWKRSPALLRMGASDYRYFVVSNLRMLWWRNEEDACTPEAAGPNGGPKCKGIINLLANECTIRPGAKNEGEVFALRAKGGVWSEAALDNPAPGDKTRYREFIFDTRESEFECQDWVDAITAHLEHAQAVQDALDAWQPYKFVGLHSFALQHPDLEVSWAWADAGHILGLKNPARWSRRCKLAALLAKLKNIPQTNGTSRPVRLYIVSPGSGDPVFLTIASIREATYLLEELVDVQRSYAECSRK